MRTQFIFLINVFSVDQDVLLPLDLGNGFILKRGTKLQVDTLKERINELSTHFVNYIPYHENEYWIENGQSVRFGKALGENEWNFYIVEREYIDITEENLMYDFKSTLFLNEKILAPILIPTNDGVPLGISWDDLVMNMFYRSMHEPIVWFQNVKLSKRLIMDIKNDYQSYIALKIGDFSFISKAIDSFTWAAKSPWFAPLKAVELFSIIELLITHKKESEASGSITHQAVTKLNLINNLLPQPFDFKKSFPLEPAVEKINDKNRKKSMKEKYGLVEVIKLLYAFRSSEAHGGESDFNEKLVLLGSKSTAQDFLQNDLIPKLLKYTLKNNQLILDLKAC